MCVQERSLVSGFPGGTNGEEPPASTVDVGSIPGLGRCLQEGVVTHSVFSPGESHGQRSLAGYNPRVTESDMTEAT